MISFRVDWNQGPAGTAELDELILSSYGTLSTSNVKTLERSPVTVPPSQPAPGVTTNYHILAEICRNSLKFCAAFLLQEHRKTQWLSDFLVSVQLNFHSMWRGCEHLQLCLSPLQPPQVHLSLLGIQGMTGDYFPLLNGFIIDHAIESWNGLRWVGS